jgi:uncharacterized membrane protein YeaQ/YmgE (transglycosylase-associated protein family)
MDSHSAEAISRPAAKPTIAAMVIRVDLELIQCSASAYCTPGAVAARHLQRAPAMTVTALIWFLLIGMIAGWLAGKVMRGGGFGIIGDMIVGVIGAFIGGWLFSLLGIGVGGLIGSLITAFVGAVILLAILRAIRRA